MKFNDLYKKVLENQYLTEFEPDLNLNALPSPAAPPQDVEPLKPEIEAPKTPEQPPTEPDNNEGMPESVVKLAETFKNLVSKGARFSSFIYKTNGTSDIKKGQEPNGPTKIYKLNFGINYDNIKNHNKAVIEKYEPKDKWEEVAKAELLTSLSTPYDANKESVYVNLGKGIRYNKNKKCLNVLGQVTGKAEIVAPGEEKPREYPPFKVRMTSKGEPWGGDKAYIAKAKKDINYTLKDELRGGLTSYDLDQTKIGGIKLSGDVIEFHGKSEGENLREE